MFKKSGNVVKSNLNDFEDPPEYGTDKFEKDTIRCKNCLWRTWESFSWNRINFKQSTVNLYLRNWIRGLSINQSEEEHTHFDDKFIYLSKVLVASRNRRNKE